MKKIIDNLERQFKSLTRRDQISLTVIVVVVVLFFWESLLRGPLEKELVVVEHDITEINSEIFVMQAKIKALQNKLQLDVDSETRSQLERLQRENERLEKALEKTTVLIVDPQEMVTMLEQMLLDQEGLKFISLKNQPATQEFIKAGGDNAIDEKRQDSGIDTIYRHSVILEVEGSYHDVLSYLKKLEDLPWRIFWQGLEIESKVYPNASVILEVYTLGFREGIIGA